MPACHITLSESVRDLSDTDLASIRDIVAEGLNSRSRPLDRNHIVTRVQRSHRIHMLGDMELEVFAQFYLRRYPSRDHRAEFISRRVSQMLRVSCATWINMSMVGYARVTPDGKAYFSD